MSAVRVTIGIIFSMYILSAVDAMKFVLFIYIYLSLLWDFFLRIYTYSWDDEESHGNLPDVYAAGSALTQK